MPIQGPVQPAPLPQATPLKYARDTKRLYCRGIDLNSPVDSVKDMHYPILENMRSYTDGEIIPRQGITQVAASVIASKTPVHSVRRLNNKLNSTYTRVIGVGNALANGQTSFSQVQYNSSNLVMSGNPLSMVPWRPTESPVSWMYIADSSIATAGGQTLGLVKLTYDGSTTTVHQVGLPPPNSAPTVELSATAPGLSGSNFGTYADILSTSSLIFQADGTVATGYATGTNRVNATITALLHDSGSTGWCSIVPNTMANIGPGTILTGHQALTTYQTTVAEVYRAGSLSGNTVSQVLYDNNPTNTGLCTVVPTFTLPELKRNAVVLINGSSHYYRILETITGPNNVIVAIRINTGATPVATGQSFVIASSFRTYDISGILATDTFSCNYVSAVFAPSGGSLVGTITTTNTALGADFSTIFGVYGVNDLDYIHYSFKTTDLAQMSQGRLLIDVDDGTFKKNYYYRAFTPSDLTSMAKGTQTIIGGTTTSVQNQIITNPNGMFSIQNRPSPSRDMSPLILSGETSNSSDFSGPTFSTPDQVPQDQNPTNPRDQTGTGDSQWSEIRFRRGDFIRVGTDWSKGWQTVQAIQLEITLISGATSTTISLSSLGISGGNSPDIGDIGAPYLYRYRYRCSTTGVASNWSPATREGVLAYRNGVTVTPTAPSNLPEVDKIDFQRWGGLVTSWANIGTSSTSVNSGILLDVSDDDFATSVVDSSVMDVNFQPWLIPQRAASGTASIVSGTLIKDSGTSFNLGWVKGTAIKIGTFYTFIRRVISTSVLEVDDSVGASTSTPWEVQVPYIASQSLPCFWGGSFNGWFFACGDPTNPGRLYFSNQNQPDTTQDSNWMELTGPSEPLQNGCIYNGRCYVFTSERMIEIVEIGVGGQFIPRDVPTGKGLMYRWALAVGPRVWFLSKDGIYETDGGIARSITFDQLYPLFPKEGRLGSVTNGFNPPNMTTGNITVSGITADASTFFRMAYYDDYVYFDYPDTNNRMRTLTYGLGNFSFVFMGTPQSGWFPDVYNPGGTNTGIVCHYGEEGDGVHTLLLGGADTTTGILYTYGGTTDNGTAASWHFRQASFDAGDRRADKVWGDFVVDADPGTGTINVAAGINNYSSTATLTPATITGSGRHQTTFDISSGNGIEGKNLAIDLTGTGLDAVLYLIEPSFDPRPEDSYLRATQYDDTGYQGEKFFQGIEIEADTKNQPRTVQVQYDGGQLGDTLTITHNGRIQKPYSFASAFVAHLARLIPTDSNLWKLYRWRWINEPEPPLVTVWESQQTSHGHVGFIHLRAVWFTHTSTADLTLTITRMDDNTSKTFTIPNSGGVRGQEFYLILGPAYFCKGKTYKYKITQVSNTPFRIYQRQCGVLVKPWGSAQEFGRWVGWGGDSGDGLAQI